MEHKRRKTDNQHNGKVGIREVYDIVYPMNKATEETKLDIGIIKTELITIKEDIGDLKKSNKSKISIRAFATWLSVTTGILLLVFIILGFYYRGG